MNTVQLNDTIAQLEDADKALHKHIAGLKSLVRGLPCNTNELLALLSEVAEAEEDCQTHFIQFEDQLGIDHDKQSQECHNDWDRCYNRRKKAIRNVVRFAIALKASKTEVV